VKTSTRIWLAAWAILASVFILPLCHSALGYPFTRSGIIPEPNPIISFAEATADRPSSQAFTRLGFREVGRGEAYTLTLGSPPTQCDYKWRASLRAMKWGDTVHVSGPLPGNMGICDWYSARIVDSTGKMKSGFDRPGPRKTGQIKGPAATEKHL